jgi:hypothetical protein
VPKRSIRNDDDPFRFSLSLQSCKLPFYLPMTNEDYPFGLETMFASTALELLTFKLAI